MTKLEQIRHGYNDGQTIFRRQSVEVLLARIEELEAYCDKLAAGLPDGMLPKDVENLREANAKMAQKIYDLEKELALEKLHSTDKMIPDKLEGYRSRRVTAFDISGKYYDGAYMHGDRWMKSDGTPIPFKVSAWCEMEAES